MVLPLDIPWCPVFLGIGIDPQRIPGYPCRWHVTLGILSPQVRIIHTKPKQTETTFQICFSNAFQLGTLASELQGSRSSSVLLSSKPLVISPMLVTAERWAGLFQKETQGTVINAESISDIDGVLSLQVLEDTGNPLCATHGYEAAYKSTSGSTLSELHCVQSSLLRLQLHQIALPVYDLPVLQNGLPELEAWLCRS